MVADVTRRMLKARGHAVWVANAPEEVLGLWAELGPRIDLVICDVAMAQMRGPELIARMSEKGKTPRVLFITGYSEEAVHAELKHPVLTKPFTSASLWRAINDAIA
jgi:CheY-like chemotaxis protein